jgi:hypothetical protein
MQVCLAAMQKKRETIMGTREVIAFVVLFLLALGLIFGWGKR